MFDVEITPEEFAYSEFADDDTPFVRNPVQIQTEIRSVYWLFRMVNDGRIQSLSPYLQRILLTKVWQADDFNKSKSFVRDMWMGLAQSTPFFLVPLDLVLENIEEKEQETKDDDILHQINEVKTKILEFKTDNVEYINLDGQTRSKESIVPYITSKFTLDSTDNKKPVMVRNRDGRYVDISQKLFSELEDVQKGYFYQIPLVINIMLGGSLDAITGALISINSNEKWTPWQEIYNGTWISVYPKRISEVYELDESGPIKDFFSKKVKKITRYNPDTSGWELWVAEHLYFLKNKTYPTIDQLRAAVRQNGPEVPQNKHSKALRGYLMELRDNYTSNTVLMHQFVSDWCLFRDIISNYSLVKSDPYYTNFDNLRKLTVLSISQLFEWFAKKIDSLTVEYILDENGLEVENKKSYIVDGKNLVQRADSYPAHKSGGFKLPSIMGRMKILINELNEDFDGLVKQQTISENTSMPSKSKTLAANNFTSNAKVLIQVTKSSGDQYERGHVKSRKNGGEDRVGNLKPQTKKANRAYSGRNMLTD
jgi:hypothetical protein